MVIISSSTPERSGGLNGGKGAGVKDDLTVPGLAVQSEGQIVGSLEVDLSDTHTGQQNLYFSAVGAGDTQVSNRLAVDLQVAQGIYLAAGEAEIQVIKIPGQAQIASVEDGLRCTPNNFLQFTVNEHFLSVVLSKYIVGILCVVLILQGAQRLFCCFQHRQLGNQLLLSSGQTVVSLAGDINQLCILHSHSADVHDELIHIFCSRLIVNDKLLGMGKGNATQTEFYAACLGRGRGLGIDLYTVIHRGAEGTGGNTDRIRLAQQNAVDEIFCGGNLAVTVAQFNTQVVACGLGYIHCGQLSLTLGIVVPVVQLQLTVLLTKAEVEGFPGITVHCRRQIVTQGKGNTVGDEFTAGR